MPSNDNSGITKLAAVLSHRIKKETESPLDIDAGVLKKNLSLICNSFPVIIPKGEYRVLGNLPLEECRGKEVLVAWVGNDAIILGLINDT